MSYTYRCYFEFKELKQGIIYSRSDIHRVSYSNDGIWAFTNGFWITHELKFTKGSDAKYWIPPSQILYIEKVKVEES